MIEEINCLILMVCFYIGIMRLWKFLCNIVQKEIEKRNWEIKE